MLFLTEVIIALCFNDDFVRPYLGDMLVVILLYCAIKTFFNADAVKVAAYVLLIAFTVEISQYFKLAALLGIQNSTIAQLLLGTSFSIVDLLMYVAGTVITLLFESQGRQFKPIKFNNNGASAK